MSYMHKQAFQPLVKGLTKQKVFLSSLSHTIIRNVVNEIHINLLSVLVF